MSKNNIQKHISMSFEAFKTISEKEQWNSLFHPLKVFMTSYVTNVDVFVKVVQVSMLQIQNTFVTNIF